MSEYETTLEAVRAEMAGQPAEVQIEYRIDCIVRELDELCAMANNAETVDLVDAQRIGIGQVISRAQLIQSFLMARKPAPPHIRRVS
ncbi:hypothetical protein [Bradyrhizobium sp.]|uniref:hypothetical protein n=1 Tax=Bradyrhizobium sp. TaxID=376 RepID=UPI0025B913BA|nr:hypothetical protein [Bradyrhizobium sp.]